VTVTIERPAEAQARLEADARRRGITFDQLIPELAARPPERQDDGPRRALGFVDIGSSADGNVVGPTNCDAFELIP